ncbi:hypothetical protein AHiyo4_22910 [Arthrobacter sp. Hiyo4]|nr:hypothetical protein AHiyo4_22910 [Arthrobacter sp. Hiyo4]
MPDEYWARADARARRSLLALKTAAAWSWYPKAIITSWPVTNSSTCAFNSPVSVHWRAKCAWDFRATITVIRVDKGTETSAIRARSGEIHSIMAKAPHSIRTDMISCVRTWLSACEILSMSLVTRLRTSPLDCSWKYVEGSRCSLS